MSRTEFRDDGDRVAAVFLLSQKFGDACADAIVKRNPFETTRFEKILPERAVGLVAIESPRFIRYKTILMDDHIIDLKGELQLDCSPIDRWSSRRLNYFDRNPGCEPGLDAFLVESVDQLDKSKVYTCKPFGSFSSIGYIVAENLKGKVTSVSRGEVVVEAIGLRKEENNILRVRIPDETRPAALLGSFIEFEPEGYMRMVRVL